MVAEDIARRQALGIAKYGTTAAENPLPLLEWLRHAYEESLDLPIYLRRAIAELEGGETDKDAMIADLKQKLTAALEAATNK